MNATILEAFEAVQTTRLFCVGSTWEDRHRGECQCHTVIDAADAETALRKFRSQNRHVSDAWIIH